MTTTDRAPVPLSRAAGHGRPAAPVRIVHVGLGNFFRAHQAWYTDQAPDAAEWGIAAFTGRSAAMADALNPQDGLYTLITRAGDGDTFDVISSVVGGARRGRPRGVDALLVLARAGGGHPDRHRGRVHARPRRRRWTPPAPTSRPTSPH